MTQKFVKVPPPTQILREIFTPIYPQLITHTLVVFTAKSDKRPRCRIVAATWQQRNSATLSITHPRSQPPPRSTRGVYIERKYKSVSKPPLGKTKSTMVLYPLPRAHVPHPRPIPKKPPKSAWLRYPNPLALLWPPANYGSAHNRQTGQKPPGNKAEKIGNLKC